MRPSEDFGNMVHLPSRDESSLNLLRQLFIHQMMINQREAEALMTWSFSPISTVTAEVAGPSKEILCYQFRDSNIQLRQKVHQHGLELVLSKRKRRCGNCHGQLFLSPALQCTPCNFIICLSCADADQFD
ncbi:hypothetical protein ACET3Z_012353 [Daucus carota]